MVKSDCAQEHARSDSCSYVTRPDQLWPTEDQGFAASVIRGKARQLARRRVVGPSDHEDVEQQLTLQLWKSLPNYDPAKGCWRGFASAVVNHRARQILRDELAPKRDRRRLKSLSDLAGDHEGAIDMEASMVAPVVNARMGAPRRDAQARAELAMDMDNLIGQLPEHHRKLLELLRSRSMSSAAVDMGIPRSTLRSWMAQIRKRSESSEIAAYLED